MKLFKIACIMTAQVLAVLMPSCEEHMDSPPLVQSESHDRPQGAVTNTSISLEDAMASAGIDDSFGRGGEFIEVDTVFFQAANISRSIL